jgi:hypothetical protein
MLRRLLAFAFLMFFGAAVLHAQAAGPGQRQRMPGIAGTITAIDGQTLTLKTFQGQTATVQISSGTVFLRGQQPAKASDLKVGEAVIVFGEQKDGIWLAKAIRQPDMTAFRQELGRHLIAGEIKNIDGARLTILRPDGQTQVIEVDENTSFRNQKRESITLADIKAGDSVFGRGEVKNGTFIPRVLNVGNFGGMGAGFPPPDGGNAGSGPRQQPGPADGKGR